MTSPISKFIRPRPALAGCLTGMVVRDTRGCALDQAQRFNFLPIHPCPSVIWRIAGDTHLIDQPDQMTQPWTGAKLPSFYFFGAQHRPTISWNPGEYCYIGIAFVPDMLSAMTGLDLSAFTGRVVAPEQALTPSILEAFRNFFDSVRREPVEKGFSVLEDKIETMWAGARPASTSLPTSTADYITSLVHRAAVTGSGRSTRQIARRVKSWTGVSERDLRGASHVWQFLLFKMLEVARNDDVDWAGLAATLGFSDQAHMIRRIKQYTGFTPKQLSEGIDSNESFWYYRLMARAGDEYLERFKSQQAGSVAHFR